MKILIVYWVKSFTLPRKIKEKVQNIDHLVKWGDTEERLIMRKVTSNFIQTILLDKAQKL